MARAPRVNQRAERVINSLREPCPGLQALIRYSAANPGFDPHNYFGGDYAAGKKALRQDQRMSLRGWCRVKEAARQAADVGVTDEDLLHFENGRCVLNRKGYGELYVHVTAGQYLPTEFRHHAATLIEAAVQRRLAIIRAERSAQRAPFGWETTDG